MSKLLFALARKQFVFRCSFVKLIMCRQMYIKTKSKKDKKSKVSLTWVHLSVVAYSVGLHNVLEARSKFVGPY